METSWIRSSAAVVALLMAMTGVARAEAPTDATGTNPSAETTSPATDATGGYEAASGEAVNDDEKQGDETHDGERIAKLESKIEILAHELSKALADSTVPEEMLVSMWGLGPAASKVYRKDHGLSIGGYGEYRVTDFIGDGSQGMDTEADALRAVVYVGYKFSDKWIFNSEIEFEHGTTGENGSVSVEFLTLDWQFNENHGMRSGLLLAPMGFVNEIHEPTFFYGNDRPEVERRIIPSTWRAIGGGLYGQFLDGRLTYRTYGLNGFDASGFSVSGLRGGRQSGSEAIANQWAYVARADYEIASGLEAGGSVYVGPSGQRQTDPAPADGGTGLPIPNTLTTLYEFHIEYKAHGVSTRGLFTQAFLHDTGALNTALGNDADKRIASRMLGAYAEVAYDVLPLVWSGSRATVEPFFRYERLDTQNRMSPSDTANLNFVRDLYVAGLQVKPIPNIVFKVNYTNIKPKAGVVANQVQVGAGYVF